MGDLISYQHHDNEIAGLDSFALELGRLHCYTHIALRAGEALGFSNIGMKCLVIVLLGEALHLGPDGGILWAQEELHDLVELYCKVVSNR